MFSNWEGERGTGRYIGGSHLAHEHIGKRFYKLRINFRDPGEILDKTRFAEDSVGTVIFGHVGDLERPGYFGRLLHLVQDTPDGCVMRSRFWLGGFDPLPDPRPSPQAMREIVPASLGAGLHAHCSEEMGILASRSDPAKKNGGKPTS